MRLNRFLKQVFVKCLLFAFYGNRVILPLRALQAWQPTKKANLSKLPQFLLSICHHKRATNQALTASRGLSQIQSPLTPQAHHKKHSKANKLYLFAFLPPCFLPCFAPAFAASMRVIKSLLNSSENSSVASLSAHFSISAWLMLWASISPL